MTFKLRCYFLFYLDTYSLKVLLESLCFMLHLINIMKLCMLKMTLIEKRFEDRKMHLTMYPVAYSIIALKAREWKPVKVLHGHESCRDQKL